MTNTILGIDISKATFDAALLLPDGKTKSRKFDNTSTGFKGLTQWLTSNKALDCHACMEATGCYGEVLAQYLHDNAIKVSIVNPAKIKGFAMTVLSRNKTDKADANLIAQFCKAMHPDVWTPTPDHIKKLQGLVKRVDDLVCMKTEETNRLEGVCPELAAHIGKHIKYLHDEFKVYEKLIQDHIEAHEDLQEKSKLLASIPGIGSRMVGIILGFMGNSEKFDSARQAAAFIGLTPKQRQSGSSVRGRTSISKTGDRWLRKAFYMPALTAMTYNPVIKQFCARLEKAGKIKMQIVCAAMRKLVHIIYGVLKTKTMFNKFLKSEVVRNNRDTATTKLSTNFTHQGDYITTNPTWRGLLLPSVVATYNVSEVCMS